MSGNRWDQPSVPHKGWHCVDVVDPRADGESADETDCATGQMCGNETITCQDTVRTATIRAFKISPEGHHEHPESFQDRTH